MAPLPQTVVFLHSSASAPRQWNALASRVPARFGWRVELPALAGHEDAPRFAPDAASLAGEVDRLLARLPRALGGVHLVGHSYGGAVALKAALSGRLDVRSLALYEPVMFRLLGTSLGRYAEGDSPIAVGTAIRRAHLAGDGDGAARIFIDYWSGRGAFAAMSPERRARTVERMPAVVDDFRALFGDSTTAADLRRLDVPCLVMGGARSPRPAQDLCEVVAGSMPRARRHRFARLNHMGPILDAPAVNAVVEEFLEHADLAGEQLEVPVERVLVRKVA